MSSWEERMAARAAERRTASGEAPSGYYERMSARENWPVPPELRGYSGRDCLLWYIIDGWHKIFGDEPAVETLFDHDFGHHVMRKGPWQLTLTNLEYFPDDAWPTVEDAPPTDRVMFDYRIMDTAGAVLWSVENVPGMASNAPLLGSYVAEYPGMVVPPPWWFQGRKAGTDEWLWYSYFDGTRVHFPPVEPIRLNDIVIDDVSRSGPVGR